MARSTRGAARAVGGLLTGFGAFQAGLALGSPWGRMAYGGTHDGRVPAAYRRISGVAAPAYLATAGFIALERGSPQVRRAALSGLTVWMVLGTGLNAASRSSAERLVWTPACAATAVLAWRARPRGRLTGQE